MSQVDMSKLLYQLLPSIYRERDNGRFDAQGDVIEPGDLAHLMTVYGPILDGLHGTLQQRYYDNFPDLDESLDEHGRQRSCQPWLLPYFAQLLDVRLVSPDTDGQRAELSHAVAWRQRKGTRVSVEQVAESVGQMEVEIQEGWRRLALTPRVGDPLLPANHFGEAQDVPTDAPPAERARHPGIPAVTPDLRYASRAMRTGNDNPAANRSVFAGESVSWRQANPHGAPCFPESFQDRSARTPDLRTPRYDRGHYHPRRVTLFAAPPDGYFSRNAASIPWSTILGLSELTDNEQLEITTSQTHWNGEILPLIHYRGLTPTPLKIRGVVDLTKRVVYRFENIWLDNQLHVTQGVVQFIASAVRRVVVTTVAEGEPVLSAMTSLFKQVAAQGGPVALEYCTVLDGLVSPVLYASDCIFLPRPRRESASTDVPQAGCLRYTRYPHTPPAHWIANGVPSALSTYEGSCTHREPVFFSEIFGEPGCAVLHPAAHPQITAGAEDGGEMGAYHLLRLALRAHAVLDKLKDFLPVGMEAVLAPDASLHCAPPENE